MILSTVGFYLNNDAVLFPEIPKKDLDYVYKTVPHETKLTEGEILQIPISQLNANSQYLVLSQCTTNYEGASGDFVMNTRAGTTVISSVSKTISNSWLSTLNSIVIAKPDPTYGFSLNVSMNGHKTNGNQPPKLIAIRLTY